MSEGSAGFDLKAAVREEARRRRAALTDRSERSARILAKLVALKAFQSATTILCYVSVRTEVETMPVVVELLERNKQVAVPFCQGQSLELFHLGELSELAAGTFGIPEPTLALRSDPARRIAPEQIGFAIVPGLAFDRQGGRIGYGRGFFDKLLHELRPEARLVGLAFATQVIASVPCESHDVRMHYIVTEDELIRPIR